MHKKVIKYNIEKRTRERLRRYSRRLCDNNAICGVQTYFAKSAAWRERSKTRQYYRKTSLARKEVL
jgi:hypothetical protein